MSGFGGGRNVLRVFVANLPWSVGHQELRQFGQSFGPVLHSTVVFDKGTGLNKGYGFISFANRETYDKVIRGGGGPSHLLEGNYISISPATSTSSSSSAIIN